MNCTECQSEIAAPITQGGIAYWVCGNCGHCTERPPISTDPIERLADFEHQYDVALPDSYRSLILPTGASVGINKTVPVAAAANAPIDHYVAGNQLTVSRIFGVVGEEHDTIFCTAYMVAEWDLPTGLVLLEGDGHCWVALDYRSQTEDPPIIVIESLHSSWLTVAPNLSTLLDG